MDLLHRPHSLIPTNHSWLNYNEHYISCVVMLIYSVQCFYYIPANERTPPNISQILNVHDLQLKRTEVWPFHVGLNNAEALLHFCKLPLAIFNETLLISMWNTKSPLCTLSMERLRTLEKITDLSKGTELTWTPARQNTKPIQLRHSLQSSRSFSTNCKAIVQIVSSEERSTCLWLQSTSLSLYKNEREVRGWCLSPAMLRIENTKTNTGYKVL